MARRPGLSKAEAQVVRAVWKLCEARVRDVADTLAGEGNKADFATVQTYLRRLKAKGYLRTRREGRADVYVAAVKPGSVMREVVGDFVKRIFGGEALPLMQQLIEDQDLSDDEIDQLQQALEAMKRRRRS
jgi:BlaI family penicillinase repressor